MSFYSFHPSQKYDSTLTTTDEKMSENIEELEKSLCQLIDMLLKN
jgi:hypothetical protein